MTANMKNYEKLFLDLKKNEPFGRLGKVFKTDQQCYFLDTGTGKIAKINQHVYRILECLFENDDFKAISTLELSESDIDNAFEEIKTAIDTEHILSAPILKSMGGEMTENLEELLSNKMTTMTLEVTQQCNLRCDYCIYHPEHPSYREFGKKHMSIETAKKSIDFLKEHSTNNMDTTFIGFYGGEPLLNFTVVKEAVQYAKKVFEGKPLHFNITTNATLLTNSICDFLVENKVAFTISMDGPKEIHDAHRKFAGGNGSFDDVMKGIETLFQSYKKLNEIPIFGLNMVNAGSDIKKQYDTIQKFIAGCDWLPKDSFVLTNGVDTGPQEMHYILPQSKEERDYMDVMIDILGEWNDDKIKEVKGTQKIFSETTINESLIKIHRRFIAMEPMSNYFVNGCCTPGQRKGYVTVDGELFPCERVGNNIPSLGNVETGFDFTKINKYYVADYINESKKICKNCWAVNLCGLCYSNCYDEEGINMDFKHYLCLMERFKIEKALERYHRIYEENPEELQMFDKMEII